MGVLPCDPYEFTQLFCTRCIKTFSFRDVQAKLVDYIIPNSSNKTIQKDIYSCPDCFEISRPIYKMIFLVKDESVIGMDKIYKLHFYSYQAFAEDFFGGLKPTNLYKD